MPEMNLAQMNIPRRTLIVELGGSGLAAGAMAEQGFRQALCGPDGTALMKRGFARSLSPFELPRSIQFVAFDFDLPDLENRRRTTAHLPDAVVSLNRQVVSLVPRSESYPDAAEMLRIDAVESIRSWLPGKNGEPQKAPLSDGAGQLPTVGRVALFETFRSAGGVQVVAGALSEAISRLNSANGDANAVSGDFAQPGIDVFVIFSVAGGTGAGVFYDVLRLLGQVNERDNSPENPMAIFPIIVMPSAFKTDDTPKLRRIHALNAGLALREVLELVDLTHTNPRDIPNIVYPGEIATTATASVPVKTAILFSRPQTIKMTDLHRSIVSFVLSTVGTTVVTDRGGQVTPLTSRLINMLQGEPAPDGIGHRPVSTVLAAEVAIPSGEIAEILTQHLMAKATAQLAEPTIGEEDGLTADFNRFAAASGMHELISPAPDPRLPTVDARGAAAITSQLEKRNRRAAEWSAGHESTLRARLTKLATDADWGAGIKALADANVDLFRIERALLGHARYSRPVTSSGFRGAVSRIAEAPPANPNKFTNTPPAVPALKDRLAGALRMTANDPEVREAIRLQDAWVIWRAQQICHEIWKSLREGWAPRMRDMEQRLREITEAFETQRTLEPKAFRERCAQLYQDRQGVVDLVPHGGPGNDLSAWYGGTVHPRVCEELGLPEGAQEAEIIRAIMSGSWRDAYEATTAETTPAAAVDVTLDAVRMFLKNRVLTGAGGNRTPLLPPMSVLLREAAYQTSDHRAAVSEDLLTGLHRLLQGFVPMDFRPAGADDGVSGALHVDVFHPGGQRDSVIEHYLETTALHSIRHEHHEFHPLGGVDSISVVLRREALPATAVDEYRRVMRVRKQAIEQPASGDLLPWRQRLGHDPVWMILREAERVEVLRSILAAVYDGSVDVEGNAQSPDRVLIHQRDRAAGSPIVLELRSTQGEVSRWVDVVCAYERYVLDADEQALARCRALIARKEPTAESPSALYQALLGMVDKESGKAAAMHGETQAEMAAAGLSADVPTPIEVQFWALLRKAHEINLTRSRRWRIEPRPDVVSNHGDPVAAART